MTNVNERLCEIENMIKTLVKENDTNSLLEVKDMIAWKRDVSEHVQTEQRKLDDIFYFLVGILYAKGLVEGWGGYKL
jgi:hypothetical protein